MIELSDPCGRLGGEREREGGGGGKGEGRESVNNFWCDVCFQTFIQYCHLLNEIHGWTNRGVYPRPGLLLCLVMRYIAECVEST